MCMVMGEELLSHWGMRICRRKLKQKRMEAAHGQV